MTKQKLLITGYLGTIGTILTKAFKNEYDVYGIDIKKTKVQNTNYSKADVSDTTKLKRIFKKIGKIDYIFHLAADPRPTASWNSVLKNNINGTRNVYECARIFKVKKVVFASSNQVYKGYEVNHPKIHLLDGKLMLKPTYPIRPVNNYGISKALGEIIALSYYEMYGINSAILRLGTVFKNDTPIYKRDLKTWLSHNDLIQLFYKSLKSDVKYGIYFGVSNNKGRFWDIANAEKELGFHPQDNAANLKR